MRRYRLLFLPIALLCVPAAAASSRFDSRIAATAGWRPAEQCPGAITVADARDDTRSWTLPTPPGGASVPPSADLRRFELRATSAGVCVRWTTAAPAPAGTVLVFLAHGPWVREPNGSQVPDGGYGFELEVRKSDALTTYGLNRLGGPHIVRARVGRTGSVVSAFVPRAEFKRRPANMPEVRFVYRAFSFEVRVLSAADSSGNRRVDFWPQEGGGLAAVIEGRLCGPPCQDPRFIPH